MAGALAGGAFLSGFINVVFDRFLSTEALNLVIGKKLGRELVERLKTALCGAEKLLVDAEQKQFDDPLVKDWTNSLKDAVYKADDLLDLVFTEAATRKQVRTLWPSFLNSRDREMVSKMEVVVRRIEDLEKRRYILGLNEISKGDYNNNLSWRAPSTSLVKGNIYGREDDQEALIKMLNGSSEDRLSVIPIVGMGGVGKTTLAQWLYNNEDLMKAFDMKAWVCVSDDFDVVEITRNVIGGITSSACSLNDFNSLQVYLKEKLSEKKFFVVLDDVWSEDGDEVASVVRTCSLIFLNGLVDDYCWLLVSVC